METVAQDAAPRKLHFISCVTLGGVKGGLMRPSSRQAAVSIHKNPLWLETAPLSLPVPVILKLTRPSSSC